MDQTPEDLARSEPFESPGPPAEVRLLEELVDALLHDLRSPLSAMTIWIEILQTDEVDESTRRQGLGIMAQSVEEMTRQLEAWVTRRYTRQ